MTKQFATIVAVMALSLGVSTRQAQATTFTFDDTITHLDGNAFMSARLGGHS